MSGRVDTASFAESMNDIQDGSEVVVGIKKNDGQETILNNIWNEFCDLLSYLMQSYRWSCNLFI